MPVTVVVSASLSHTRRTRLAVKPIDRCLAKTVWWLQILGVVTGGSCCGHGKGEAFISVIGMRNQIPNTDEHGFVE